MSREFYLKPQLCACGCGEMMRPQWNYKLNAYTKYKSGHWGKVHRNPSVVLTLEEELEVAHLYEEEKWDRSELSRRFSVSRKAIKSALRRQDIKLAQSHSEAITRSHVNLNYFNELNPENVYWLGFLAADGCIQETRDCFILALKANDKEILEKLRDDLDSRSKINEFSAYKDYQYVKLVIAGKPLIKRLISLGITPRKTYTLCYPSQIPPSLDSHFIRGYFDGDGSIYIRKHASGSKGICFSLTGTRNLLSECRKRIIENCAVSPISTVDHIKGSAACRLCYFGNTQVPRIMRWLYRDATRFLARKHRLFIEFCGEQLELPI